MRTTICLLAAATLSCGAAWADALVDFDGTETNLLEYVIPPSYTYTGPEQGTDALLVSQFGSSVWPPGDAFWPMTRAALGPNGVGMPFGISDDSVEGATGNDPYPGDRQGFAGIAHNNNGFFGVIDTINGENSGPISAEFWFDVSGMQNIEVSIDFAAMGDFEAADSHLFEYSWDASNWFALFTSSVDEDGTQTYLMDNPDNNPVILDDPLLINGVYLNDDFQTITAPVDGSGDVLYLRYTAVTDGGTEGFGFDNILIVPEPASLVLLAGGVAALCRRR